jgi:asparagine N-glycosylation enzyme membrane subunit Stt3
MLPTNWEKASTKIISFFLLTFILVILRIDTLPYIFKENFINLIDPDSYYHLRRILYTMNNFPHLLNFDPYLSCPYGEYSPWPPFFDFLSASIATILGKNDFILPFLNLLYFFLLFLVFFYQLKYNIIIATITGFFLSYTGILKIYSSAGRLDHHALEMLIITMISFSFYNYYRKARITNLFVFIISLILAFLTWPGAIIYCAPIIIFSLIKNFTKQNPPFLNKGLFVAFHVTAITLAIYLKITKNAHYYPYSYKFLTAFQRDFCFVISIIFFTFHLTEYIVKRINTKSYFYAIWLINTLLIATFFHRFFFEIIKGFEFINKSDFILKTAEEASPLFFSNIYSFKSELQRNIFLFTPLLFIAPFVLFKLCKTEKYHFLLIYNLFFLFLTFFQVRFGYFFMLGYALSSGIYLEPIIKKISPIFVFSFFLIISFITYNQSTKTAHERFTDPEQIEIFLFLKEKLPYSNNIKNQDLPYGILASWEMGHHIIQIANRPAVAHPFIGVAPNNGYMDFIEAIFSKEEQKVVEIMDRRKARFLILSSFVDSLITDWDTETKGENPYFKNGNITDKVFELFLYNLFYFDGLTKDNTTDYSFLRLIEESKKQQVKLYERVKGCKIVMKNSSNAIIKAKITNNKRTFFYISKGEIEGDKRYFIVPYSSEKHYPFFAEEIYIEENGKKTQIFIPEDFVLKGKTINF